MLVKKMKFEDNSFCASASLHERGHGEIAGRRRERCWLGTGEIWAVSAAAWPRNAVESQKPRFGGYLVCFLHIP